MIKAIFVLVYIIGTCNQFGAMLFLDCKQAKLAPFIDYIILSLFWPISVWWWMYHNYKLALRQKV